MIPNVDSLITGTKRYLYPIDVKLKRVVRIRSEDRIVYYGIIIFFIIL